MPIDWKQYKSCVTSQNPNKKNIPVNLLKPTDENVIIFNELLEYCRSKNFRELKMTPSGGISIAGLIIYPAYYYGISNLGAELIICEDRTYRFQFRASIVENENGKKISGSTAFKKFRDLCEKYEINLSKYAIDNGENIHKQIEKAPIKYGKNTLANITYENVHHIDFHSSYPAGLCNTHEEFRPLINDIYEKRIGFKKDLLKAIMNYSIGMMHSKLVGFKYAQLAKDAIEDNNKRVETLAKIVELNGGIILLYNTDGFWYARPEPYHNEKCGEGEGLGQWQNDHINCKFRVKSVGAYEYIENGKYTPVVRGVTDLDKGKPREEWEWGDIFNTYEIKYMITKEGIVRRREIM